MGVVHLLARPESKRRRHAARIRSRTATTAGSVKSLVEAAGHDVVDISDSARTAAQVVADDRAERLVVVGGDGTVHLGIQAVAGTSTVLGVIAAGTGNDFARAFGLGSDIALRTAVADALGPGRPIDAIWSSRGWVASSVTGGFSGDVAARAATMRFPSGSRLYTAATLLSLPGLRARSLVVIVDGDRHHFDATLFVVANTPFFGSGMAICPTADPSDGELEVLVIGVVGRIELLRFFPTVFKGTHLAHPQARLLRGHVVEIEGDGIELWGDGEPMGPPPLTLEVVPGAVRLAGGSL